jgi:multiple sugar transport system substrate-binding protein
MKRVISLIVLLAFAFSVIGCAPSQKKDEKIVLKMWVMPNSLEPVKDLEEVLKPFLLKHPNLEIKVTAVDWGAAWPKITTAATSGDVPDIVQLGSTWVGTISSMNALWDMKDKVAELGGADAFVPSAWNSSGQEGAGQVTAIPWIVDARALFYRTDIFAKLGMSAKNLETWDGFEKALAKIKAANLTVDGKLIAPLGISGKNDWNVVHSLAPWIWAAGGDFIGPDRKTAVLSSEAVLQGLQFYIGLVKKGYVPIDFLEQNTAQISSRFNGGECAIYFDGPYEVKNLTTPLSEGGAFGSVTTKNFGVVPYPKGPKGRYTFVGGSNLAIFKASKNKEAAWEVIKHMMSYNSQVSYSKFSGFLPSKKDAFDHPYFSSDPRRA